MAKPSSTQSVKDRQPYLPTQHCAEMLNPWLSYKTLYSKLREAHVTADLKANFSPRIWPVMRAARFCAHLSLRFSAMSPPWPRRATGTCQVSCTGRGRARSSGIALHRLCCSQLTSCSEQPRNHVLCCHCRRFQRQDSRQSLVEVSHRKSL